METATIAETRGQDRAAVHAGLRADPAKQTARQGKYLVFHLGKEEYGVHVMKVREIMGIQEITSVPQTPACVKGVINLRGKVVPVIDLRTKFGLAETEYTARTCIIVMQCEQAAGPLQVGVIVDGVSEVLVVQEGEIEDAPRFGDATHIPYILGMAKVKGRVKILLDMDQVLATQDGAGAIELANLGESVSEAGASDRQ